MKKITQVLVITILLSSCVYPEQEAALANNKQKSDEARCKMEQSKFVLEYGMNIMILAEQKGLKKQVDNYNKIQTDSTISCDSIIKAWDNLSDLVSKKSN